MRAFLILSLLIGLLALGAAGQSSVTSIVREAPSLDMDAYVTIKYVHVQGGFVYYEVLFEVLFDDSLLYGQLGVAESKFEILVKDAAGNFVKPKAKLGMQGYFHGVKKIWVTTTWMHQGRLKRVTTVMIADEQLAIYTLRHKAAVTKHAKLFPPDAL